MKKQTVFLIIWSGSLVILWEGSCYLALWYLEQVENLHSSPLPVHALKPKHQEQIRKLLDEKTSYIAHDPDLGWTLKPYGLSEKYRANSQGLRANRDYAETVDPNVIRIETFGDSFTHGDDVSNEETWQEQLMQYEPRFEILNFGVGGYGIDQAYLRYLKDGKKFQPHVVLIGFMSENIARSVNVFRPFYRPRTNIPLSKPRFTIVDGALKLLANPLQDLDGYRHLMEDPETTLKALGANDWFAHHRYRRSSWDLLPSIRLLKILVFKFRMDQEFSYRPETENFQVSLAVLTEFYRAVNSDRAQPFILLFPNSGDYRRVRRGQAVTYKPLLDALTHRGMKVVDLGNAFGFQSRSPDTAGVLRGHYTKEGNRIVAEYPRCVLAKSLDQQETGPVGQGRTAEEC